MARAPGVSTSGKCHELFKDGLHVSVCVLVLSACPSSRGLRPLRRTRPHVLSLGHSRAPTGLTYPYVVNVMYLVVFSITFFVCYRKHEDAKPGPDMY